MTKKLMLDMDGTLADLYNEINWLPRLRNEEIGLFANLKPIYNMEILNDIFEEFIKFGWEIEVITWLPMNVTETYEEIVKNEKIEWINKNLPYITNIHTLKYGTPKQNANYKKANLEILIDDNKEIIETWITPKQRKYIVADENLIEELVNLLGKC